MANKRTQFNIKRRTGDSHNFEECEQMLMGKLATHVINQKGGTVDSTTAALYFEGKKMQVAYIKKDNAFVVDADTDTHDIVKTMHEEITIGSDGNILVVQIAEAVTANTNGKERKKDSIYRGVIELFPGSTETITIGGMDEVNLRKIWDAINLYAAECNLELQELRRAKTESGTPINKFYHVFTLKNKDLVPALRPNYPWPKLINIRMPDTKNTIRLKFHKVETSTGEQWHPLDSINVCRDCGFTIYGACACAAMQSRKRARRGEGAASNAIARFL